MGQKSRSRPEHATLTAEDDHLHREFWSHRYRLAVKLRKKTTEPSVDSQRQAMIIHEGQSARRDAYIPWSGSTTRSVTQPRNATSLTVYTTIAISRQYSAAMVQITHIDEVPDLRLIHGSAPSANRPLGYVLAMLRKSANDDPAIADVALQFRLHRAFNIMDLTWNFKLHQGRAYSWRCSILF